MIDITLGIDCEIDSFELTIEAEKITGCWLIMTVLEKLLILVMFRELKDINKLLLLVLSN